MRVLIFPGYEYPSDYRADSSFILTSAFAKYLAGQGHFVYWYVPPRYGQGDRAEQPIPGVETIPYGFVATRDEHEIVFYDQLMRFNPLWGSTPVDAVFTNNAGIGARLAEFFGAFRANKKVPIYIWDFSVKYIGSDEVKADEESLILHQAGYLNCRRTYEASEFMRKAVLQTSRHYLSIAQVDKVSRNLEFLPYTFSPAEIDEAIAGVEKEKVPTFFFSGRFTSTKGGEEAVRIADYLFRSGREVKIIICTARENQRLTKVMEGRKNGAVEVHTGLSQRDMWRQMARCHFGIFIQSLKMFPSSPHEWLYAGLLVAFKGDGHEKKILAPGYPLVFRDDDQGYAILRYMMENQEEIRNSEVVKGVKQWTVDNYSRDRCMTKMRENMLVDIPPRRVAKRLDELVRKCVVEGVKDIAFSALIKEVENRAFVKGMLLAKRSNRGANAVSALYDVVLRYYDDDYRSADPHLTAKAQLPEDLSGHPDAPEEATDAEQT